MPLYRWHCLATCPLRVTAMIGHFGLYLETRCADLPEVVRTTIAAAMHFVAASTVAIAVV